MASEAPLIAAPSSCAPADGTAMPAEQRRSQRRSLICRVSRVEGAAGRVTAVSSVSPDGAFLLCDDPPEPGTRLRFALSLPLDRPRDLDIHAVVVRTTAEGAGVRFTEISSRDRALLSQYTYHVLADDSLKRLQRELGDLIRGNLLPAARGDAAREVLVAAAHASAEVHLIPAGRRAQVHGARLREFAGGRLLLEMDTPLEVPPLSGVHLAITAGELQYVFETVVLERSGASLAVQVPDRIYSTERRARVRKTGGMAHLEIALPHAPGGVLGARVIDHDGGGFAIALPAASLVLPGTRLPRCRLLEDGAVLAEGAAVVRNVHPYGTAELRVGLELEAGEAPRLAFDTRRHRDLARSLRERLRLALAGARLKLRSVLGRRPGASACEIPIEIVRYRTPEREEIVGILDRTAGAAAPVDLAVVIAPALGKRKELFGLLARTIVECFEAAGKSAAVLRFDDIRSVGESTNDPGCDKDGMEVFHYTLGQAGRDIDASLRFVRRLLAPRRLALITVSIGSIPARRFLAEGRFPPVDAWISLFGCPDAWDIAVQTTSGRDVFAEYRRGYRGPTIIAGLQFLSEVWVESAIEEKLETLEDAIADLSRIEVPITWIVGTYDCWVRRERVRRLLNAPGNGPREIFEVPTGHLVRLGGEALETFKLVAESIAKNALGIRLAEVRDPDLVAFEARSRREWDRVRRKRPENAVAYWKEHLFGEGKNAGYDVVRASAMYARFMELQHELAEIGPGVHVADLGCGTGNFAELAVRRAIERGAPLEITCLDLVPEAARRTAGKIEEVLAAAGDARRLVTYRSAAMDLEVGRLKPVHDFLAGALHGVEALAGRIEGLPEELPRRLRSCYSAEIHAILRGRPATRAQVRGLVPGASDAEVDAVLDLSLAARFLRGEVRPGDARGSGTPGSTADLGLLRLDFGRATRRIATDLPEAAFDRAIASLLVSYLFEPAETVAEIQRSLRPGGIAVISSLKPNFDPSESQAETVRRIRTLPEESLPKGETRESLIEAARSFSSYLAKLLELEEQGAFRFLDAPTLRRMLEGAGFKDVRVFSALGDPGQAVVARGVKPEGDVRR